MSGPLNRAQRLAFVRMESPVAARSVHGEKSTAAAGSGVPEARRASMSESARPPPAESPAMTMRSGKYPSARRPRYAAVASSTAAGKGFFRAKREVGGQKPKAWLANDV